MWRTPYAESWAEVTDDRRTRIFRFTLNELLLMRLGGGLDDLPDVPETQIYNWFSPDMSYREAVQAVNEAVDDIERDALAGVI